ncbi:MAG TPA: ImmA/IrrE family metallo-endopeptidase [Longimicrobium sp.]|nr:ImmA/IrrE family metallo-endopeptidase [Longimicrobium sp.]
MAQAVSGLNPAVLTWARERAGLSVADVARALKKDPGIIEGWESGEGAPTYVQLETLAYKVFNRPVALFFFPDLPEEPDPAHAFRTLPEAEVDALDADTRYNIRDARALQLALSELHGGRNPSDRKIWQDIRVGYDQPVSQVAARVRAYLQVDLQTQKTWRTTVDAFKEWRRSIEGAGVYVFKNTFKQRDVSGFCLYDDEFPIIYVNNSSAASRQIFTLFHELAHILLEVSGVTKSNDAYIDYLAGNDRRIEVLCNKFAAEFLVPDVDFRARVGNRAPDDEFVKQLASEYKVSREVILRRFLDMERVSAEYYQERAVEWRAEYEAHADANGGGNYYATQATYLGDRYLNLAFTRYHQGVISVQQLADYLNIRVSSVPGLEQFFLARAR